MPSKQRARLYGQISLGNETQLLVSYTVGTIRYLRMMMDSSALINGCGALCPCLLGALYNTDRSNRDFRKM